MQSDGRSTPLLKMSSRPRIAGTARVNPGLTRSPPLTTSLNDNPRLESLSAVLTPKEGTAKLRIKSSTTPEAKSRLVPKSLQRAGVPIAPPNQYTPSRFAGSSSLRTTMLAPSDSDGSLAEAWQGLSHAQAGSSLSYDEPTAKLEASEAVLVTVRCVIPLFPGHHLGLYGVERGTDRSESDRRIRSDCLGTVPVYGTRHLGIIT